MFINAETQHPLGFKFHDIIDIMICAGDEIAKIYHEGSFDTSVKDDNSPLTRADIASHSIISRRLREIAPEIPIISEEGDDPLAVYKSRSRYSWFVDPLDGTKEFIGKTGEFTVNIALVDGERTQCGFVYVPMTGESYYGLGEGLAFKQDRKGRVIPLQVRECNPNHFVCVMSRRHGKRGPNLEDVLAGCSVRHVGSSLKGCMVAEGMADVYVRLGPTSRWDTAAMQAVVESAGGSFITLDGNTLTYDHHSILNPEFVVLGKGEIPWKSIVEATQ